VYSPHATKSELILGFGMGLGVADFALCSGLVLFPRFGVSWFERLRRRKFSKSFGSGDPHLLDILACAKSEQVVDFTVGSNIRNKQMVCLRCDDRSSVWSCSDGDLDQAAGEVCDAGNKAYLGRNNVEGNCIVDHDHQSENTAREGTMATHEDLP
jgi:hypothetical protein